MFRTPDSHLAAGTTDAGEPPRFSIPDRLFFHSCFDSYSLTMYTDTRPFQARAGTRHIDAHMHALLILFIYKPLASLRSCV
jgi:hypothetical protein